MQETRDASLILGQQDTLEKEMEAHSCMYACLKKSMVRAAWWATAHGITKSDSTEHACIQGLNSGNPFPSDKKLIFLHLYILLLCVIFI